MNIKPPAFIIIPQQLLADARIKPIEEKLYGYIYWFTKLRNERCTVGNSVLAELAQTTNGVVANSLTNLELGGYIKRTYKDRNKRVRDEIIPLIDFNTVEPKTYPKKKAEKEKTKKEIEVSPYGAEVNKIIEMFEPINPSYERLFSNKGQRTALERMIKKHGVEKLVSAVAFAVSVAGKQYAPSITTPIQLESKLGQLRLYWSKEKNQGSKMVTI